jgi:DNA-binding CsgD family transcriptional regulator
MSPSLEQVPRDLSCASAEGSKLLSLSLPERERKCEIVSGETPDEIAGNLAGKLRAAGVI